MKEFFHYILFALRISKGKVLFFLLLSIAAAICEALAAASIISAINHGSGLGENNFISRSIISLLKYLPFTSDSSSVLAVLLLFTAFFFLLRGALLMFSEWYISSFLGNLYMRLQKELLDALYMTDYQTFLSYNIGDLSNIAIVQLKVVVQSLRSFITVISSSIFVIAYLVLPLLVNYEMAMLAIITFAPIAIIIRHVSRKLKAFSLETVSANGDINSIVLQVLSNYRYLKSTGTFQKTYKKLDKIARNIASLMIKLSIWGSVSPNVMTPFAVAIICGLTYWQVAVQHTPIIEACAVLGLLYHSAQQAISVPTSYQKFLATAGSIDIYLEFITNLFKNAEPASANMKTPDFSGPIVLQDVSFQYSTSSSPVFSGISLSIPQKSFVGFVGESGSGKSTFVNMITGLLRPSSGKITISGTDYSELNIQELRRSIAYVTQEAVIFNDTVLNNISLWDGPTSDTAAIEASRKSSADKFIEKLPNGYQTMLGDNGINISGGQRQRISIARELFKDADILLLDEATSALDSETEYLIQKSIRDCHGQKTIIAVAHRLSTIKYCDCIFVLEKGKIVEHGKYDELYAKNGRFRQMVDSQSLN
ncbi:MAG TPA: hypothetical protein DET40_18945 [Lentisphaeria bacterium]|nr:MAG: hypothetical protein A2X45_25420 [Lentisphaerae bacterium GWF2_50_93]HCE45624.1 hypothetical protein [Lentisphaeria bacterium]